MIWTVELAAYLDDAPWPASKDELYEYADQNWCTIRSFRKP